MKVPMTDLNVQYHTLKTDIDEAILRVVESGQFIMGPDVKALEEEIAAYLGVKYAVGVASGTEALQLALVACGIKPGDEVITTPFTFIATTEVITQCGATPVFVDIDPQTYNLDTAQIESRITGKTRAILPVHLYGQAAATEPILGLAAKHGLKVIEDCAQALGAEYKGRKVGSLGDAGCLSFFPSKILGAYGDGGMVVTGNPEIAEKLVMLRNHGGSKKYFHAIPGFNSRLDSLQAAILRIKLKYLGEWIARRQKNVGMYSRFLGEVNGIETPCTDLANSHVFNYYTVRLSDSRVNREQLCAYLGFGGIATAIYYPLSLHLQQVYQPLGYKKGDFPVSERAQDEVLSLPMYPELTEEQIAQVAGIIKEFCAGQAGVG